VTMRIKFFDIDWDTSTDSDEYENVDAPILPDEVTLDVEEDIDVDLEGADILSDKYGFCIHAFSWDYDN
jgi:hypothetical protein